MLETLAKKYPHLKIDLSAPDWGVILFNHLCGFLNIESEMIENEKIHREDIAKLEKHIERLSKIETFIAEIATSKSESSIFKNKLKSKMLASGLTIDQNGDDLYIKVTQ